MTTEDTAIAWVDGEIGPAHEAALRPLARWISMLRRTALALPIARRSRRARNQQPVCTRPRTSVRSAASCLLFSLVPMTFERSSWVFGNVFD